MFNVISRYYIHGSLTESVNVHRDLKDIEHLHLDLLHKFAFSLAGQYGLQMTEILKAFQ